MNCTVDKSSAIRWAQGRPIQSSVKKDINHSPFDQIFDSSIQEINYYGLDKYYQKPLCYPLFAFTQCVGLGTLRARKYVTLEPKNPVTHWVVLNTAVYIPAHLRPGFSESVL